MDLILSLLLRGGCSMVVVWFFLTILIGGMIGYIYQFIAQLGLFG